jgi:hypothetical protein
MNRTQVLRAPRPTAQGNPVAGLLRGLRRLANMLNGTADAEGASIGISSQDYLAMIKPTAQ